MNSSVSRTSLFWTRRGGARIGGLLLAGALITSACASAGDYADETTSFDGQAVAAVDSEISLEPATEPDAGDAAIFPPATSTSGDESPVLEVTTEADDDATETTAVVTPEPDEPAADAQPEPNGSTENPPATTTAPADDGADPAEPGSTTTAPVDPTTTTTTTAPAPTTAPPTTTPLTTTAPAPAPTTTGSEPDCGVSCNIVMEGDSLTVGLGNRLCSAYQTGNCVNSGIVGRRVDEMRVTARSDVDNQLGSGNNDVVILWGGTNDLWQKFHSPDAATNAVAIYQQIVAFVQERRDAGWDRVYVMTLPPMNQAFVVGTEPLNDLIRANSAGADGVIDVGTDPRLADPFNPAVRAPDGVHFGDGGRAVVMEHIFATLATLDGLP